MSINSNIYAGIIVEYITLTDNANVDISDANHESLKNAINCLYAIKDGADNTSHTSVQNLLHKASKDFIIASDTEKDENRIVALTGLFICKYILGDISDIEVILQEIKTITLSFREKSLVVIGCMLYKIHMLFHPIIIDPAPPSVTLLISEDLRERKITLKDFQQKAMSFCSKLLYQV